MKNKESVKSLVIALIFGIIAFVIVIIVNSNISRNEINMVWSVKDIPQGTTLTEKNIDDYVSAKLTNDSIKNSNIILDKKDLIGKTAARDITSSELMQESFFLEGDDIRSDFKDPVLVSFSAKDFSSTANGIIRRGDYINVAKLIDGNAETSSAATVSSAGSSDTGTADVTAQITTPAGTTENLIAENTYVVDAFDSSGKKIEPGDTTSIATSFNIYIERENETSFYNAVKEKNVAVSKIESAKAVGDK